MKSSLLRPTTPGDADGGRPTLADGAIDSDATLRAPAKEADGMGDRRGRMNNSPPWKDGRGERGSALALADMGGVDAATRPLASKPPDGWDGMGDTMGLSAAARLEENAKKKDVFRRIIS